MPKVNPTQQGSVAVIIDDGGQFQVAQAIYNAVTGKTEKLSRAYTKNYLIHACDLVQLHEKCLQACTQWTVLQKSSSIVVHHIDDNKEQFSSMERFTIYDVSKTAPVESVVYEFNILIALPNTPAPQNYKVVVRCLSRVGAFKKMEDEVEPFPFGRYFTNAPILVEIEYVDYVVARNLLAMVDSWAAQVEQLPTWNIAKRLQKYSHLFDRLFQTAIIIATVLAFGKATELHLNATSTPPVVIKWLLYVSGSVWVFAIVAGFLGDIVEGAVDRILQISAIKLNKGDERLIAAYKKRNILKCIEAVCGTVVVLVQGIAANYLTSLLARFV